jgi:hypothetical protein
MDVQSQQHLEKLENFESYGGTPGRSGKSRQISAPKRVTAKQFSKVAKSKADITFQNWKWLHAGGPFLSDFDPSASHRASINLVSAKTRAVPARLPHCCCSRARNHLTCQPDVVPDVIAGRLREVVAAVVHTRRGGVPGGIRGCERRRGVRVSGALGSLGYGPEQHPLWRRLLA